MSDALNTLPAGQQAPTAESFTGDQIASARQTWLAAGLPGADFDRAVGVAAAENTGEPQDRPQGGQASEPAVILPTINAAEADALAERLAANGMTDEQVAAELARQGYQPDERSEAQIAWDAEHMLDTARDASQYRFDLRALNRLGKPVAENVQLQADFGDFLSAMQMPPTTGVALIEHMARQGRAYMAMTPTQQELHRMGQEYELLRQVGSPEKAAEIKRNAGLAIQWAFEHAKNQGAVAEIVDAMHKTGNTADWYEPGHAKRGVFSSF